MTKIPTVSSWIVPPTCQGQIVERAYGVDEDGYAWRRITDRSDGSVSYARADMPEDWEPASREPNAEWESVD